MPTREWQAPATARALAAEFVRNKIYRRELLPGQKIVQEAVSQELGTSRIPVREALRLLEGEGLVAYRAHHGYTVTVLDPKDVRQLYAVRDLFETHALRRAVAAIGPQALAERLEKTLPEHDPDQEEDLGAVLEDNRTFHFAMFEASGSDRLVRLIRRLWDGSNAFRALTYSEPTRQADAENEHRLIVEALQEGDVTRAIEILRTHRQRTVDLVGDSRGTIG